MTDDLLRVLNPAQREAAAHVAGPILVLAGAGSGKTRVLTTRIAQLIAVEGVRPERIFAVTFTNKAAGEMKARVGELLSRDPTGLWIGTFHSLSGRLLRREAERIGFTRGYTIYDQDDTTSLVKRLLDERNHLEAESRAGAGKLVPAVQPPDGPRNRAVDGRLRLGLARIGAPQRVQLVEPAVDFARIRVRADRWIHDEWRLPGLPGPGWHGWSELRVCSSGSAGIFRLTGSWASWWRRSKRSRHRCRRQRA